MDIGFIGDIFTWHRRKIRERLDWGVAKAQWSIMFPNAKLVNAETFKSDHRPSVVDTEYLQDQSVQGNSGPWRFEARWIKERQWKRWSKQRGRVLGLRAKG